MNEFLKLLIMLENFWIPDIIDISNVYDNIWKEKLKALSSLINNNILVILLVNLIKI